MQKKKNTQTGYNYPINYDWSTKEIIDVIYFFECIEQSYEHGIEREKILSAYQRLKEIVPSKSEEKKLFAAFEEKSGYSSYHTVQKARNDQTAEKIKME